MRLTATLIVLTQDPAELKPLFDSLKAAGVTDYVIGIDDKSHENTPGWLHGYIKDYLGQSVDWFHFTFEDDFAKARNMTLDRLPEGTDWWLWIDSDDTLEVRGTRTIPEYLATLPPDINAVFCDYEYHRDQYGNVDTLQVRHRILSAREKWFWANRVHEDVHIVGNKSLIAPDAGGSEFVWIHHPDETKRDPDRNFRILKKAIEEEPNNIRNFYYLANQHFAAHQWKEAIEWYAKYVPGSNRVDEKWSAYCYEAKAYQEIGEIDAAMNCYLEAMAVQPKWADPYFGMGECNSRLGRWDQAIQWGEVGLGRCKDGDGFADKSNFQNQNAYLFEPYVWLNMAYYEVGDNDKALACLEQAVKHRPEPELVRKLNHMVAAMSRTKAIDMGKSLAAHLARTNEPLKARGILQNLPAGAVEQDPVVGAARMVIEKKLAYLRDDTAYRNHYFSTPETIEPIEQLPHVPKRYPRMHWVLERLRHAGAKRVLELGIGNAVQSLYLAQNGIQVVGIDVDWQRVKQANHAAVKLGYLKSFRSERLRQEMGDGNGKLPRKRPKVIDMPADAQVQFHCCPADQLSEQVKALGPFDAVVATEIIEHVEHPEKVLDMAESMAKRVIVSTPDAAYDGPQEINSGHVQGWSQREMVPLIAGRGRIESLHKIDFHDGSQPNIMAEYVTGEVPGEMPVIIWCFNTGQQWTPDSIHKGGIGGSETAVIRMAEELVKRNCRVTVYAECEGVWNGVRYAHTANFTPQPCYLFVSWRSYGPTAEMKEIAKQVGNIQHHFIWSHDLDFGDASAEQLEGVKVVALSEYHRRYIQEKYPTADVIVSGNGIDAARFEAGTVDRVPHRLIYAQSPDRGLDVLLRMWPKIHERYGDATLEVFYGMDLLDRTGKRQFRREIEDLAQQPGVTLHGRVDQQMLAIEYLKSDALIYPGIQPNGEPFYETYGISIIEAQAAGCVPITPSWGALPEVNQYGVVLDKPTEEQYLSALFGMWDGENTPFDTEHDRPAMMDWARQQTWTAACDRWLEALSQHHATALLEATGLEVS